MKRPSGFQFDPGITLALVLIALLVPALSEPQVSSDSSPIWLPAQSGTPVKGLEPGRFLVATRDLGDPNFIRTIILLAAYDKDAAMGLVLNRPLKLPISRLFRDIEEAKSRDEPVYEGGPVLPTGILALLRSKDDVHDGGSHIFSDVYLVNDAELLEEIVRAKVGPSKLKIFAGYSGWGAGQLDVEVEHGAWHIFRGDAASVFDPEPKSIWKRFIDRTELRIAMGLRPKQLR